MLLTRREHVEQLSEVPKAVFEERMLAHINKHFPAHYSALGEKNCREVVRYGIERASTHGFVSERDVCKFIDLILCFGVEFDTDSKQPWASTILKNPSWTTVALGRRLRVWNHSRHRAHHTRGRGCCGRLGDRLERCRKRC